MDDVQSFTQVTDDEKTEFVTKTITTQTTDFDVYSLHTRWKRGKLDLQPDFQRHFVWDVQKASRLIESILLRVPLPAVYLSEEKDSSCSVIDGQQRLTSLFSFIDGKFPNEKIFSLKGLNVLEYLEGKTFKELDEEFQDAIYYYSIRVITFPKDSDENLKFEIFERLNTGSMALNPQELRNCIYRGNLNNLIKNLAKYDKFRDLMGYAKEPSLRMEDCEYVLRFAALYKLGVDSYKPSMKSFMNKIAKEGRNFSEKDLNEISEGFKKACQVTKSIFDKHAFKRFSDGKWEEKKFNASLYDILMVSFAKRDKNNLMRHSDAIREALIDLMANDIEFNQSIMLSTSARKNVELRFRKWNDALDRVLDDADESRTFSLELKRKLFQQNPICSLCNNAIHNIDDAAVDHVEQYWLGGKTIPENARLTHRHCNNSRPRKE